MAIAAVLPDELAGGNGGKAADLVLVGAATGAALGIGSPPTRGSPPPPLVFDAEFL
jgi:hypothetical protein